MVSVDCKSIFSLDVPTRWNSTYLMLKTACIYDNVFEKYEENESFYSTDLADDMPDVFYWFYVSKMVEFL